MLKLLLTKWTLALLLVGALAAPAMTRAAEPTVEPAAHHATVEEANENPGHNEVVSVQLKESAWIVIIFLIVLAILYPVAWKPAMVGLKAREDRIRKDIADAEAARTKAEASLRDYTAQLTAAEAKVREMIGSASAEAERISTTIKMQAQAEAESIKERATKEIDAARKQALQEIYTQTAELSTSIAEKILKRNLNADDQRDLVTQSLEQLQNA